MANITKCIGADKASVCPSRNKCFRFTAPANSYRQSYFAGMPALDKTGKCNFFLEVESKSKHKRLTEQTKD